MTVTLHAGIDQILNQSPPYENIDLFSSDRSLTEAVEVNGAASEAAELSAFGRQWGKADMFALARRANENPPKLYTFDPKGFRRALPGGCPGRGVQARGNARRRRPRRRARRAIS